MSAYSKSGRFQSRIRLLPVRDFIFWFVISVIGMDFRLLLEVVVVCLHIARVSEGSVPWRLAGLRLGHRSIRGA